MIVPVAMIDVEAAASRAGRHLWKAAIAALVVAIAPTSASTAEAARYSAKSKSYGSVTSCSRWGNGCLTLPVRRGRFGYEARGKGGTWIDCRGDCEQALREDVIDFWETQADKAKAAR